MSADASGAAEPVDAFWERCGRAWSMLQAAAHEDGGKTVAVVTHSSVISGILCRSLEMGPADLSLFRTGGGSVTLIGFPGEVSLLSWCHGWCGGVPGVHDRPAICTQLALQAVMTIGAAWPCWSGRMLPCF